MWQVIGSRTDGWLRCWWSEKSYVHRLAGGRSCVCRHLKGAVAALVPFFDTERAYTYAAVAGIVLAASLLSSVAQPLFGALTDR